MMESADQIIEAGKAAWAGIRDGRRGFDDWILISKALQIGKTASLKAAATNRAVGSRYNAAMGQWLRNAGLDGISAQERYRALQVLENLDAITAFRDGLPESTRRTLNHPAACFHRWRRATKTAPIRREMVRSDKPTRGSYTRHVSFDGETIKRAATALRENWSNDTVRLAIVCLQAAFRNEDDLLALLPPPAPPRQKPAVRPAIEPAAVMQVPA